MDINTVSSAVDLTINTLATVGGGAVLAAVLPKQELTQQRHIKFTDRSQNR